MRRRYIIIVLGVIGSIALAAATFQIFRTRPMVSDEDLDEAIVWLDAERAEMLAYECPRPPLRGEATAGDGGEALRAVLRT